MDDAITVRVATPADAAAISELTRDAYAKWVREIGREPKPVVADYGAAVLAHRFDLLYVGEGLAALIETVDEVDQLLIENVAVSPAFQRRGLGSSLLRHAEGLAWAHGYRRLRLSTNAKFVGNVRLYERLGYRVEGETAIDGMSVRVDMATSIGGGDETAKLSAR